MPTELDLVLDDYHLVDDPDLQSGMTFLVEHLPPQVHLVISTRVDPALPLARLRARGELVEIRAADLRFTLSEASAYFNDVAALALTADDVAALEARTEGWVAALQLAALSLRAAPTPPHSSPPSPATTATSWTTWPRRCSVASRRRSATSCCRPPILDRSSGPLCEAVTGNTGSQAMLEHLDRANLFLVPLDGIRRWYRYHHLFAEVLRTHLLDERPEEVADLHRRASRWYDEAGEPVPAVRHAVAAGDIDRAADLAELAMPALQRDRQEATIAAWLDRHPRRGGPDTAGAGFRFHRGADVQWPVHRSRGPPRRPRATPRDPANDGQAEGPAARNGRRRPTSWDRLPAAIELYRSALALIHGDPDAAIAHADRATSTPPTTTT